MTDDSVLHATFTLERTYPAEPARVFAAWAEPAAKARWFAGDAAHELDFRVGGRERVHRPARDGTPALTFESVYHDITDGERIVYAGALFAGDQLATVSLTTVEFSPDAGGTRLVLTEQGAYLDGLEQPGWREQGTGDQLAALAAELTA
ncbi:MAG: SRPBCC domain-containing protein [Actinobacteria bacterium]|nr:SRPBCC domain-containing protein [Actinomycetota bacterium]